jgi:hypothetical protein
LRPFVLVVAVVVVLFELTTAPAYAIIAVATFIRTLPA